MESWNFSSEGKTLFFSDETTTTTSSPMSAALGLSKILCANLISPNSSSLSLVDDDSASFIDSTTNAAAHHESSLIALKLGTAGGVDRRRRRLKDAPQVCSSSSSSAAAATMKRARTRGGCYSQTTPPLCQVLGCNMDLSDSKDYHKKHKVCDLHSKSPKVVVNGVEQRFCQQCSRFHLLGEFDDGKRSCRRRLAGHNERRRKPQFDGLSDKPHKFSHPFQGGRYLGATLQKRPPFVFSDILPGANPSPEFGQIKFEDDDEPVSVFGTHHHHHRHHHHLDSPAEKHQLHRAFETEDYFFGVPPAPTLHKPHGATPNAAVAPCALSLLSSPPPQILSNHNHQHQHHHTFVTVPQIPSRAGGFYSSGMDHLLEPPPAMMFPEATSHAEGGFEVVVSDRAFHGPKYCLAPDHHRGSTVDLLQLSTHLHRVEHQRNFMQVKQENDDFCCFPTA